MADDKDRRNTLKIGLVVVLGLAALVLILLNTGVINLAREKAQPSIMDTMDDAQKKEYENVQKQRQLLEKDRPPVGA